MTGAVVESAPAIGSFSELSRFLGEGKLLYLIIEHFRNNDPVPVYRRFRDCGRLAPEGLHYVSSWVDDKLERCFQLMETEDRAKVDEWILNWKDLVEFEVYPVIPSNEAAERVSRLSSPQPPLGNAE